ncbi:MAG: NTP transferase domain-containing protein, partial [Candidatus Rokubacteria bacterium]|nr:NTP transferase domain-containing protein [Candidatus Rokubacteria bacterium]
MAADVTVVVLAAGEGKRMRSRLPKALHRLGGRPLIAYPVSLARRLGGRLVVVVGRGGEDVRQALGGAVDVHFVEQKERLGTGHALREARSACRNGTGTIVVLPGDTPLLSETTLRRLVDAHRTSRAAATLLTAVVDDPTGYGRIVRDAGRVTAIVEDRDASPQQKQIREIGTSIYCFDARHLWPALAEVRADNDQGEYYLTDIIGILKRRGQLIEAVTAADPTECLGINDRKQLAQVAALLRARTLERLMAEGVTVLDPASTYVDDTVSVGSDSVLAPGVVLEGATVVGAE